MSHLNIIRYVLTFGSQTRAKTSIPVPEVHGYDIDAINKVGAPYVLMDYIHGTVATELQELKDCDIGLFGTPDQDRNFKKQMANIQAELFSHQFDQIGSLYQDEKTSEFFIGPEIETGKGPWTASMDYFVDLANHGLETCVADAEFDVQLNFSFAIPIFFNHLIKIYGQDNRDASFRLTNRDFGAHNVLVNDDFEIVGVIDFDGVMAAPIEVVAQYPQLTGLDREPPGHIETKPLAIERIIRTEPKLEEYKEFLEMAERRISGSKNMEAPIANMMLSNAASVFQGMREYMSLQRFVNDMWMDSYLDLLHDHLRREDFPAS